MKTNREKANGAGGLDHTGKNGKSGGNIAADHTGKSGGNRELGAFGEMSADATPLQRRRICRNHNCDCTTFQTATSNLNTGAPVWRCTNCLAETPRKTTTAGQAINCGITAHSLEASLTSNLVSMASMMEVNISAMEPAVVNQAKADYAQIVAEINRRMGAGYYIALDKMKTPQPSAAPTSQDSTGPLTPDEPTIKTARHLLNQAIESLSGQQFSDWQAIAIESAIEDAEDAISQLRALLPVKYPNAYPQPSATTPAQFTGPGLCTRCGFKIEGHFAVVSGKHYCVNHIPNVDIHRQGESLTEQARRQKGQAPR